MTRILWLTLVALLFSSVVTGQVSESLKRHEKADIAKLARITRADHSTLFFFFGGLANAGYIRDGVLYSVILEHGARRSDFNYCLGKAVSRDGSRIAYSTAADGPAGCRIVVRDLGTTTEKVLTISEKTSSTLSWLPGDSEIAYGQGNVDFVVSGVDGTKRQMPALPSVSNDRKVLASESCAAVSSGGDRIAYTTHSKVWIVNTDGTNRYPITSVPAALPFLFFLKETPWKQIVWSPNEDRLWFSTIVDEGGNANVYLVDIKSGRRRRILKRTSITITDWRQSSPIPNDGNAADKHRRETE